MKAAAQQGWGWGSGSSVGALHTPGMHVSCPGKAHARPWGQAVGPHQLRRELGCRVRPQQHVLQQHRPQCGLAAQAQQRVVLHCRPPGAVGGRKDGEGGGGVDKGTLQACAVQGGRQREAQRAGRCAAMSAGIAAGRAPSTQGETAGRLSPRGPASLKPPCLPSPALPAVRMRPSRLEKERSPASRSSTVAFSQLPLIAAAISACSA